MDPIDERDAKDPADVIASGCFGDQGSFEFEDELVCSLDVDFRSC